MRSCVPPSPDSRTLRPIQRSFYLPGTMPGIREVVRRHVPTGLPSLPNGDAEACRADSDLGMVQTQVTAQGWRGLTPEGRRPQIRGWCAGGSLAVASSTPATPPSSATRNYVCFACMICYDLLRFPEFLKSWRAVFFCKPSPNPYVH